MESSVVISRTALSRKGMPHVAPSQVSLTFRFVKSDGVIIEKFGQTKWLRDIKGERRDQEEARERKRKEEKFEKHVY